MAQQSRSPFKNIATNQGFSLVEILISLFIVSIASVSVYGLQKMVIEQNRNNVAHSAELELSTEKMADVLKLESLEAVMISTIRQPLLKRGA